MCAFNTSSSVDGHLGCFHILTVVNNSAMKIGIHVSFQISVFIFFGTIPNSEIIGLFGGSVFSCCFFFFLNKKFYWRKIEPPRTQNTTYTGKRAQKFN